MSYHSRNHHYSHNYYHERENKFFSCSFFIVVLGILLTSLFVYKIRKEQRRRKDLNRNSVVLITGGCKGVGRELALTMARNHHCNIIIFDSAVELAQDLLQEIHNLGAKSFFYEINFRNKDSISLSMAQVLAEFTRVDIFIHTGGMALEKPLEDYCYEDMLGVMEANFFGPTILIKELLAVMKERGQGHIITVPSMVERFTSPDIYSYCGIKSAIGKMLQGVQGSLLYAGSNVKVTIVGSSFTLGHFNEEEFSLENVRKYAEKIYNNGVMAQDARVCYQF